MNALQNQADNKRIVFKAPQLQKQFEQDGYVVVPLLSADIIKMLWEVYNQSPSGIKSGFYTSLYSSDVEHKNFVNRQITELCGNLPNQYLLDYKPIAANFIVKIPGTDSDLPVHQDWTIVDETQFTSVNCWFPLMEVTMQNGPFMALKGSHKHFTVLRGSPNFPSPLDGLREIIKEKYLTPVEVKVGEVLFHDHKLVHHSPANNSQTPRVAACMNMIPAEATPLHYYRNETGLIEQFAIDDRFYPNFSIGNRPDYPVLSQFNQLNMPTITPTQLEQWYGKTALHTAETGWWNRVKSVFGVKTP